MVSVYFRLDRKYNTYNRQTYSMNALLGDIGGMYSSLYFIGLLSIGFYNRRLFISAILKNLYQVKHTGDHFINAKAKLCQKFSRAKRHFVETSDQTMITIVDDGKENNKGVVIKSRLSKLDVDSVLGNIVNRRRFRYLGSDILAYLARCLCIRSLKHTKFKGTREEWELSMKHHYHYKEGEDKLYDELDVVSLLKSMRRVKLLT